MIRSTPATQKLLEDLATRPGHDEVKSDFRQLLVEEFGVTLADIDFERRVPEVKGRLDALIGRTVFEAKRNLDREWADVERRMPEYLADREREEGERFVGLASDGLKWVVFELKGGTLAKIRETVLDPENGEAFLAWLDGALALKDSLSPDPLTVRSELGGNSVAFRFAADKLAEVWGAVKSQPAVLLKRQLWAQLLKLVYGRDVESDRLFFQHTFLVIVAKAIALAVLDLPENDPKRLLSGAAFAKAGVNGAAESDFFDWVVASKEGEELVGRILKHVRRFRLDKVESDVLKILYESLIDRDERHGLGEYYTPDWLAAKIVREAVDNPMEQRVLDPACGSGTFLFHAVRNYLAAAEESGVPDQVRASEATAMVSGLDIHPVAVIIARVTFLLALAPVLDKRKGTLSIPVYLGDAMQLSTTPFMDTQELVITTPPDEDGNVVKLAFPEVFCSEPAMFDEAIEVLRAGTEANWTRKQVEAMLLKVMRAYFLRMAGLKKPREVGRVEEHAISELGATFEIYDKLCRSGRDTIWSYVARNLSRPLALSSGIGWAAVVVGNPPWVAFRHMSADLQKRFRSIAKGERVHVGGKFATQNDLSALFTVRAAGLYLRGNGRLAFVLPLAALTRGQFELLRGGSFGTAKIAWDKVWTMDDSVQPLFPVPSCVVFGRRRALSKDMPDKVRAYSGQLPYRDAPEEIADKHLAVIEEAPKPKEGVFEGGSVYRNVFRNGATLYPRMFSLVERHSIGRLGSDSEAPYVASRKSGLEKKPWSDLDPLEGRIEAEFLKSVLLGESILPYRVFRPFEGVVPVSQDGVVLDSTGAANRGFAGLHKWMSSAESLWREHAESVEALAEQFNHHGKLASQFPLAKLRVVYAKSGTLPAACIVRDKSVIDHMLYWASVVSEREAHYLIAIFNSETARGRTAELQSRGQWGARHFDKVVFTLPIPRFDPKQKLHCDLAELARQAEVAAAAVVLPDGVKFQRARKLVRGTLIEQKIAPKIDALVAKLLDKA